MKTILLDCDIREALKKNLRIEFSTDSVIRDEFGCAGARVDVAVINGRLHGFEIKSERDNLDRLTTQTPAYSALFDNMTVVAATKHLRRLEDRIPPWWGIQEVTTVSHRISLKPIRSPILNTQVDPVALVQLLWRKEMWAILRRRGLSNDLRNAPAIRLQQVLIDRLSLNALAEEVRTTIKFRDTLKFYLPQTRNDDSCTTGSNSEDYQTNLNWLLSLQSHRLQR
jgi:hypothetical protein